MKKKKTKESGRGMRSGLSLADQPARSGSTASQKGDYLTRNCKGAKKIRAKKGFL